MRHAPLLILLLSLVLVAACRLQPGYSSFQTVASDGWDRTESIDFQIDTLRGHHAYQLTLHLACPAANPYRLQALTLEVEEQWNSQPAKTYTVECQMADDEGAPIRDGISTYRFAYPLHTVSLPDLSTGTVRVRHKMRSPIVEGVSLVGLELKPVSR